jgi:hypothetical protein
LLQFQDYLQQALAVFQNPLHSYCSQDGYRHNNIRANKPCCDDKVITDGFGWSIKGSETLESGSSFPD